MGQLSQCVGGPGLDPSCHYRCWSPRSGRDPRSAAEENSDSSLTATARTAATGTSTAAEVRHLVSTRLYRSLYVGILEVNVTAAKEAAKAGAESADLPGLGPMFLGQVNGSLGEISALALLAGGLYLCGLLPPPPPPP